MTADVSVIAWVEQGKSLDRVTAKTRDSGANVVNSEMPASWPASRTRPLRVYPRWRVQRVGGYGECEQF